MTARDTRLFGLLASIWGGILIYFYVSMRVSKYLAENFHHFVLIGGIGILILGLYSLINPQEKEEAAHDCGHDHSHEHEHSECCGHDHDHHHDHAHDHCHEEEHDHSECCGDHHHEDAHGPGVTYLLTLVPLLIAMTFTKDGFSEEGLARQGAYEAPPENQAPFTREDLEKNVPKNAKGEFQISLVNAYYAGGDKQLHEVMTDLPVEIEGRLMAERINNEDGTRRRIFRTFISCCAADATVAGISLDFGNEPSAIADKAWVKVGGKLSFEEYQGRSYTVLKVSSMEKAEEPYSEFLQRSKR